MKFVKTKILQDSKFFIASVLIVFVATLFRFYDLTLKPLHHDEGVNGYFLTELFNQGVYKYDPSNYHGPTLYYIALVFTKLLGLETFAVRASVAIFGVLMVILVLALKNHLGNIGSLSAAAFVAVTPGMVYISRYFIHEIFFVFCSLGFFTVFVFFIENRKPGYIAILTLALILFVCFLPSLNVVRLLQLDNDFAVFIVKVIILALGSILVYLLLRIIVTYKDGLLIYPMIGSAFIALFFATKETAFITIGTMIIAVFCIWLWEKLYKGASSKTSLTFDGLKERFSSKRELLLTLTICLITFTYVAAVFFSSFFTYPRGIIGAFEAYSFWTKTGIKDHIGRFTLYLEWLWKLEYPLVLLSLLGILIAFFRAKSRFAMFVGLWAFGLFLAYSLIPYKTPWLMLSFLLPMCIASGYSINEMAFSQRKILKFLAFVLLFLSLAILSYNSYDLNFRRYDDDSLPYVYAHTRRSFLQMVEKIHYYAEKSGRSKSATIQIVSPEYWPLPWYLKQYDHANFYGRIVDAKEAEMIIAEKGKQDLETFRKYRTNYRIVDVYSLRPGVDLVLLVRKDLADEDTKSYEEIIRIK
ncbi:MAG: TIGR03663 family protein [Pyrinomonadaceae bacterium]|nr:TIGR03663 family protein [Pyrinomonadaceae bacterium]MCX7640636.1 TIGR03663 family protein [Pyrinomonadaceae bacterium]MDW8305337.1 TIGR03663 family protein [Acidobacteriota bacterium]